MAIVTGNSYKLGDLVHKYTKTGVPIFRWYRSKLKTIGYLLFEPQEVEITDETGKSIRKVILKPRSINGIMPILTETGNSIKWWEQRYVEKQLRVNGNQANVSSIVVKAYDVYTINSFVIDDVVTVHSTADNKDYIGRITNIDPATNTITLSDLQTLDGTSAPTINVNDDDAIVFRYNAKNPDDTVAQDGVTLMKNVEYESFFSYINGQLTFSYNELNKTYEYPEDVEQIIRAKFNAYMIDKVRQFANSLYFGTNTDPTTGKSSTLGIITGIKMIGAKHGSPNKYIHDLSSLSDDQKINSIIDILAEVYDSGVYEDGVVTMVATKGAIAKLQKMSDNWYKLGGLNVYTERQNYLELDLTQVKIAPTGVTTEWMTDEILNEYAKTSQEFGRDFIIVLPRKKIGLYQLTNKGLDVNGKLMKWGPNLEFTDVTQYAQYNKVVPNATFLVRGMFATVLAGLGQGAYRIIKL